MEPKITSHFFLLSINPKNGSYYNYGNEFQYGLLGCQLMDLYREKRFSIENKMATIGDATPTEFTFLDRFLDLLHQKRSMRISSLITRIGFRKERNKKEVAEYLVQNKIIIRVRKKFLFISYNRYFPADREIRMDIVRRLRDILLRKETPLPDEMYLLSLIRITRLIRALSDRRDERKAMRQQLKLILANGEKYISAYQNLMVLTTAIKRAIMAANAAKSAH